MGLPLRDEAFLMTRLVDGITLAASEVPDMRFKHKGEDHPERPMILVIEADASIRECVSMLLEDEGYAVVTCDSILHARESIDDAEPDLIILDPWTRGAARWDVLDGVGAALETARIPWIVYSTDDNALNRRGRLSRRPYPSLSKPFASEVLVEMVGRLIDTDESVEDKQPVSA
jgi:DNA-binding NtrC family response regulator